MRFIVFLAVVSVFASTLHAGEINGTVIDGATDRPVAGAEVRIAGTDYRECTDSQGRYSFEARPGWGYEVRILWNGYSEQQLFIEGEAKSKSWGTVMYKASDTAFGDCKVRPIKKKKPFWADWPEDPPRPIDYMLYGLVADFDTAQPLSGVIIWTRPHTRIARTNSLGQYVIWSDVSPQDYTVSAISRGYYSGSTSIRVRSGRKRSEASLTIRRKQD